MMEEEGDDDEESSSCACGCGASADKEEAEGAGGCSGFVLLLLGSDMMAKDERLISLRIR